jgi:hypothetical protein
LANAQFGDPNARFFGAEAQNAGSPFGEHHNLDLRKTGVETLEGYLNGFVDGLCADL